MQMVDILNTFCEQTHVNNLHFHVFLVKVASALVSDFFQCWCLMQSFKLAKDSERTNSKMLLFCIVLIFAHIFMTFDRYLLDR